MTILAYAGPAGILGWVPGYAEIIVVALLVLLLFGGKKLPELARGLGKGLRSFKEELKGVKSDIDDIGDDVKTLSDDASKDVKETEKNQASDDEKS